MWLSFRTVIDSKVGVGEREVAEHQILQGSKFQGNKDHKKISGHKCSTLQQGHWYQVLA